MDWSKAAIILEQSFLISVEAYIEGFHQNQFCAGYAPAHHISCDKNVFDHAPRSQPVAKFHCCTFCSMDTTIIHALNAESWVFASSCAPIINNPLQLLQYIQDQDY